ncbi:MAG TPA: ROK family protein [Streptosporangiaceae bacterium]
MQVLGIDIGGSGIKAAPVDTKPGKLLAERVKLETPQPAVPGAVAKTVGQLVEAFSWTGPTGITFPGVVVDGKTLTAANLDPAWIGLDTRALFSKVTGLSTTLINDADAAGLAEMSFGAGAGQQGTVLMVTFGTGIGSALFRAGLLVPNTEFGHIEIRGRDAEHRASERAKEQHALSWEKWAERVDEYLHAMERLTAPDLIIIGGGISRKADRFLPLLTGLRATVVPAALHNDAGIVGAGLAAGLTQPARAGRPA